MNSVWGVFQHINCSIDGESDTIRELIYLCTTEQIASRKKHELEKPKIEELINEGWSYSKDMFLGYSYHEIDIIE